MEQIAEAAGLTKRTLYNNYADKETLFLGIVRDMTAVAEAYARELPSILTHGTTRDTVTQRLTDAGERLALAVVREEVISLRRLLIGEGRAFPTVATEYFERAPGQVLQALSAAFQQMARDGVLHLEAPLRPHARLAAEQFAYLVAGAPLDRAMLTGIVPKRAELLRAAAEGVTTFLARYYQNAVTCDSGRR